MARAPASRCWRSCFGTRPRDPMRFAASFAAAACICMQIARVPSRARDGLGCVERTTRRDAALRTGKVLSKIGLGSETIKSVRREEEPRASNEGSGCSASFRVAPPPYRSARGAGGRADSSILFCTFIAGVFAAVGANGTSNSPPPPAPLRRRRRRRGSSPTHQHAIAATFARTRTYPTRVSPPGLRPLVLAP